MPRKSNRNRPKKSPGEGPQETTLRIVGGKMGGRKLKYAGDNRVRPMKDRVREALFNLLGPPVKGTFAIDLFGGTGALALEAISRGAIGAIVVERHIPTSKVIRENIESLNLGDEVQLVNADAFRWWRDAGDLSSAPWVVFISPPYRFFTERMDDMLQMIESALQRAPEGSMIAVEATKEFDFEQLPHPEHWDVRTYPPAVVGLLTVTDELRASIGNSSQAS